MALQDAIKKLLDDLDDDTVSRLGKPKVLDSGPIKDKDGDTIGSFKRMAIPVDPDDVPMPDDMDDMSDDSDMDDIEAELALSKLAELKERYPDIYAELMKE